MRVFLLLLVLVLNSINSEPIKKQTLWLTDYFDIWYKRFCGLCNTTLCQNDFDYISTLDATGKFKAADFTSRYNVLKVQRTTWLTNYTIYQFPKILINTTSKYVVYRPTSYIGKATPIKGIIYYFHPTTFGKGNAPSSYNNYFTGLGMFFASQNYILIQSDYIGYGDNPIDVHPYVFYPQNAVKQALVIANDYWNQAQKYFPDKQSINFFTTGYSEGALYSGKMMQCQQQQCQVGKLNGSRYNYKGAACLEGPYDLSIVKNFLLGNISKDGENPFLIESTAVTTAGKPALSALAIQSYAFYSLGNLSSFKSNTNINFFNMKCAQKYFQHQCQFNLPTIYNLLNVSNANASQIQIASAIGFSALAKGQIDFPGLYGQPNTMFQLSNSIRNLYNNTLLGSKQFDQSLQKASIADFGARAKKNILIFTLKNDSLVSPRNAYSFLMNADIKYVQNQTFLNYNFKTCPQNQDIGVNVDHNGAQYMSQTFALNFFDRLLLSNNEFHQKNIEITQDVASEKVFSLTFRTELKTP